MKRILIAGESWMKHITHIKGFDIFTSCEYEEGVRWLRDALVAGGWDVRHMPAHAAWESFPHKVEELLEYDVIILSDIGSNTLLIPPSTFNASVALPDRCEALKAYVEAGGGLGMIGGYLSFSGIDAKARYGATVIGDILPVTVLDIDDRAERSGGVHPSILDEAHPIMKGLGAWPRFLGYNKTVARSEGQVLATIDGNPFVAVREFGKGRTAAFTSDCSPHWGPPEFVGWEGYGPFWNRFAGWLAGD
jgi:uncharacterized membrane protein